MVHTAMLREPVAYRMLIGSDRRGAGIAALGQFMPQSRKPLPAHARLIDLRDTRSDVEPERRNLDPIPILGVRSSGASGIENSAHVSAPREMKA